MAHKETNDKITRPRVILSEKEHERLVLAKKISRQSMSQFISKAAIEKSLEVISNQEQKLDEVEL